MLMKINYSSSTSTPTINFYSIHMLCSGLLVRLTKRVDYTTTVEELQEEGKAAIDGPGLNPAIDVLPEEFVLGTKRKELTRTRLSLKSSLLCCFSAHKYRSNQATDFVICLFLLSASRRLQRSMKSAP